MIAVSTALTVFTTNIIGPNKVKQNKSSPEQLRCEVIFFYLSASIVDWTNISMYATSSSESKMESINSGTLLSLAGAPDGVKGAVP